MKKKPQKDHFVQQSSYNIFCTYERLSVYLFWSHSISKRRISGTISPHFISIFPFLFLNIVCPLPPCSVTIPPACVVIRADEQTDMKLISLFVCCYCRFCCRPRCVNLLSMSCDYISRLNDLLEPFAESSFFPHFSRFRFLDIFPICYMLYI